MKTFCKLIAAAALISALVLVHYSIQDTTKLPVLMYHHFAESSSMDTVVSETRFRQQMEALHEAGFTSVTLGQVMDFVDNGTPLPEKAVLITMDDGYDSNLDIAAPILEENGLCATVFVIGVNEGEETYAHSGVPFYHGRFSYEEAAPWVEKGVLDIQSHTYDMHQLASYGFSGRDGVRPMEGESHEDYLAALGEDFDLAFARREGRVDTELVALAYPFGFYTPDADRYLEERGIRLTFTVEEHTNYLHIHDTDCLRCMGRFNVTDRYTGTELVQLLLGEI